MDYTKRQKILVQKIRKDVISNNYNQATIVEPQDNYENDEAICLTSVVFPAEVIAKKIIKNIIKPLRSIDSGHYYYYPQSLHLTIKNIRTVHNPPLFNDNDIKKVDKLFKEIISKFNTFNFILEGLTVFPTSISLIGYSSEVLQKLVMGIDKRLKSINIPDNKKYVADKVFFGNITLCRFNNHPSEKFLNKAKELENINIGEMPVKKISLITCNSVCSMKSKKIINTYSLLGR